MDKHVACIRKIKKCILLHLQVVMSSDFGPETGYSDRFFTVFLSNLKAMVD